MKIKKRKVLPILGFSLLGLASGLFSWYEFLGGREIVNYKEVVVLKEDVTQGTDITNNSWTTLMVDKNTLIKNPILDPRKIIGKQAKHYIPAKSQLTPEYFAKEGLVLKAGQYVAQIPIEWTLSSPDSIRRGDNIIIYSAFTDKTSLEPKTQNILQANSKSQPNNPIPNPVGLKSLINSKVAYVKDSSNREVINVSSGDRLDGSAPLKSIEIITTPEDFKIIENEVKQGAKLVIMYD